MIVLEQWIQMLTTKLEPQMRSKHRVVNSSVLTESIANNNNNTSLSCFQECPCTKTLPLPHCKQGVARNQAPGGAGGTSKNIRLNYVIFQTCSPKSVYKEECFILLPLLSVSFGDEHLYTIVISFIPNLRSKWQNL